MILSMLRLRDLAINIEPLRQYRDYRLIFMGQLINNLGSQVTQVALPYQLYVLTHSALALGALATIRLVAILIFSLAGGALADAMDRRRLLITTQTSLCLVSAILAALAITQRTVPWHIYLLAFIQAIVGAVDRPARQAMIPRLVGHERLSEAIALNQAGMQMSSVVGPALGGLLIASVGLSVAYALDAVSFLAAIAALLAISKLPPLGQTARGIAAILEGVRYVRQVPAVLSAFAIDLDAMIFGMPVALFPVMALDVFHVGSTGLGLMVAAPAVGAVTGVLTSGWAHGRRYPGRVVIGAVAVWGISMALFGLSPFFPLALVFLAIGGGADAISAVLRWTLIQITAPDNMRGRMTALNGMVVNAGPRLGDIESTTVAALTNAQISVVSGGLLCLVGLVFVVRYFPQLSTYDALAYEAKPPTSEPQPAAVGG